MRWKLQFISSTLAAIVGAGFSIAFTLIVGSKVQLQKPGLAALAALAFPILSIAGAAFFVYRHTARRRKLQAMLTVLLASFLTLTLLIIGTLFLHQPAPANPPAPRQAT